MGDDVEQGGEFGLVPREVVGTQEPQGDHADPGHLRPAEELLDLVRSPLVPLSGPETLGSRPTPIAIKDDADVTRHSCRFDLRRQAALIELVDEVVPCHASPPGAIVRHVRAPAGP